jgi:hypothetical protein
LGDSNKEVDNKLNTLTEPGDLSLPKGKEADIDAAEDLNGLLGDLESRLDDLFAFSEKDAEEAEKHQKIKPPLFDNQKAVPPYKGKARKTKVATTPAAEVNKGPNSPTIQATAPAAIDSQKTKDQKQKEALFAKKARIESDVKVAAFLKKPGVLAAEKTKSRPEKASDSKTAKEPIFKPKAPIVEKFESTSVGRDISAQIKLKNSEPELSGPAQTNKTAKGKKEADFSKANKAEATDQLKLNADLPDKFKKKEQKVTENKIFPIADKIHLLKNIKYRVNSKPVESKKEPEKTYPKQDKKKDTLLKLTFAGIIFVGSVLAFLVFIQTPDPPRQNRLIAIPTAHKIIRPPPKAPEAKTAGPAEHSISQPHEAYIVQSESPIAAASTDKLISTPPSPSAVNANAEIKEASGWKINDIKPQTPTTHPYSIHAGSYRTLPPARETVEAYRKMGLEAYWTLVDLGEKGIWYRVFIGYYSSLGSALETVAAKALNDVYPLETRYANLIGSYSSKDDLRRQRLHVTENGYSSYVISDDNGNLNLYMGAYASLENAEKFSAELNTRGISARVVER